MDFMVNFYHCLATKHETFLNGCHMKIFHVLDIITQHIFLSGTLRTSPYK